MHLIDNLSNEHLYSLSRLTDFNSASTISLRSSISLRLNCSCLLFQASSASSSLRNGPEDAPHFVQATQYRPIGKCLVYIPLLPQNGQRFVFIGYSFSLSACLSRSKTSLFSFIVRSRSSIENSSTLLFAKNNIYW